MDDKQRVRQAADILDVIGTATVLKHKGGPWYQGLCPFHQEKTPSFRVNAAEGIYKCFGCDAKGDVFRFLMEREGLDFRSAMRSLADRFGVTLSEADPAFADAQRRMREAMAEAQRYFHHLLLASNEGATARDYARRRGLSDDIVARFGIGASPTGWDSLQRHLVRAGFALDVLEGAGLVRPNQSGSYRDYFRGRLMFPICGDTGAVLAFGARTLDPQDPVKYINSPDTPLYHKGQHVFGLHLAKDAIRKADCALVVEGYMDVVALHQAGFAEAVAVLGTAMTQDQARSLLRYTDSKRVVVAFDADRAGQDAAGRAIGTLEEVARAAGLFLSVLTVPGAKDPDEFIKAHGEAAFRAILESAPGIVDFQIDMILGRIADPRSPAGQDRALTQLGPVIRQLGSGARAEPYVRKVAARLGLNELHVQQEFDRHLRYNGSLRAGSRPVPVAQQRVAEAERGLIYLMVEDVEVRRLAAERLGEIPFPTHAGQALRERLATDLAAVTSWSGLLESLEETSEYSLAVDLRFAQFEGHSAADALRTADQYVDTIAAEHYKGIASSRQQELSRTDLGPAEFQRIAKDFHDAHARAMEHQARLSGRHSEPAARGS